MLDRSSVKAKYDLEFSFYERVFDILPAAVYMCDLDGYVTFYNNAAVRLWGREPVIGKDLWCGSWKIYRLDGTDMPLDECPMAKALRTKMPVLDQEIIVEQPNGNRFNVLPHPHPLYDNDGTMIGAINMLVDVTGENRYRSLEQKTTELTNTLGALRQSEERYHRMIAEVEDYAIILLSKDGIIQNWNKGAEKIKGYSEAEIIGKSFKVFYSPDDQASGLPDELLATALTKGKANHEGWRIRKDGSRFWGSVSITALHDSNGGIIGFSKVTRDLTERRNQELKIQQINEDLKLKNELLRRSEERYQRMVAEVEDYVIILLDENGRIENWNRGAQKIKGYSAEEIVGKHFSVFYIEEDRKKGIPGGLLTKAATEGKALHEGWRIRKDGSRFWGSVVITALHNDDGTVIGFTKVTRDLTEKKLTEEQLLASSVALQQKNRELERINEELSSFAYISSHDLQEPLRKIQTFCDRIREMEYEKLSDKGKDYFIRMQAGASRMQNLIRDILAYSRMTTAEKILEMTDLNDLLAHAKTELEVLISEKRAAIVNDRMPIMKVIPFQIQQLLNNLLNNALKFSRPGVPPHVVIKCERIAGSKVRHLYPLASLYYYHITFADNGIGFEPEYSKKIFEVFQRLHARTEYGGTGIGLAICKKIVENHNGFIFAESQINEGATFHVYLPIVE